MKLKFMMQKRLADALEATAPANPFKNEAMANDPIAQRVVMKTLQSRSAFSTSFQLQHQQLVVLVLDHTPARASASRTYPPSYQEFLITRVIRKFGLSGN